jgi:hypothetical protein
VVGENLFSEKEKMKAKKIFMGKLDSYLEAQRKNNSGF